MERCKDWPIQIGRCTSSQEWNLRKFLFVQGAAGASSIKNTTLNKAGHTYSEHAAPPILEVMTSIEHIYSNTLHIPCAFFEDDSHLPSNPFLVFALGKRKSSFERTGLIEGEATAQKHETLEGASLTSYSASLALHRLRLRRKANQPYILRRPSSRLLIDEHSAVIGKTCSR